MAATMDDEEQYENLEYKQRLKAALHYTVGKICEQFGEENSLHYSRQFVAALTETTYKQIDIFASDLELFAKHGKRSVINGDDVVLLSRRSLVLHEHIKEKNRELNDVHLAQRANRKSKKKGKTTTEGPTKE